MIKITATWDGERDITKVTFSKDYQAVYNIAKLDFLKDVIEELECEYNRRRNENRIHNKGRGAAH